MFAGVVALMERGQKVNLPPWKVSVWFPKVQKHSEVVSTCISNLVDGVDPQPDEFILPRLAESWVELTDECSKYKDVELNEGWLITETVEEKNEDGVMEKRYKWTARLVAFLLELSFIRLYQKRGRSKNCYAKIKKFKATLYFIIPNKVMNFDYIYISSK